MQANSLVEYVARLPEAEAAALNGPLLRVARGRVAGQFLAARLSSVFQGVQDRNGECLGHAAYARCAGTGAGELSPWKLFAGAADDDELVRLDRLVRTVHVINYFVAARPQRLLFLLVDPRLLSAVVAGHGSTFERVLASFGVGTSQVAIVLPDGGEAHPGLVARVASNYRRRGYRVALRLREGQALQASSGDYVLLRAGAGAALAERIAAVHAGGALALVTHVETPEVRAVALAAGADGWQGYLDGAPEPLPDC